MKGAIAMPLLPFFKTQSSSPSVRAACRFLSVKFLGIENFKFQEF
jgi:hypothetical protein